jgi:hypothetical protein
MNYKDLQNISYLSQQILTEAASEEHDVMNRWPYASPYLQEERAEGVRPYKAGPTQAEVRADAKKAAQKKAEKDKDKAGYGPEDKFKSDWKLRAVPSSTSKTKDGTEETVSKRMNREKPYATRPFSPLFTKQGSRTASAVTRATEGPGEPQSVTMPRKKSKPSKEIVRKGKQEESFDLYDLILSHLLDEGYADTEQAAEAIMVNMSEEWRQIIVEQSNPYGRGTSPTPMKVSPSHSELQKRAREKSEREGVWLPPYIGPSLPQAKNKTVNNTKPA